MHALVQLAKNATETYVKEGKIISAPFSVPKEFLERKAGVFVSIHNNGRLRGCIGTYTAAKDSVADEVVSNAIAAATEDNRFDPLSAAELPDLAYEVYVLGEPKPVRDMSELDPKIYGVIVRSRDASKCGLLLPDLDGVDRVEDQIFIAAQKGGIDLKRETVAIYKFSAEKYS